MHSTRNPYPLLEESAGPCALASERRRSEKTTMKKTRKAKRRAIKEKQKKKKKKYKSKKGVPYGKKRKRAKRALTEL